MAARIVFPIYAGPLADARLPRRRVFTLVNLNGVLSRYIYATAGSRARPNESTRCFAIWNSPHSGMFYPAGFPLHIATNSRARAGGCGGILGALFIASSIRPP